MHVSGYYGNLNHSDDVYSADGTEKAKGVVVTTLVLPKTPEHEEQFHENHCKCSSCTMTVLESGVG